MYHQQFLRFAFITLLAMTAPSLGQVVDRSVWTDLPAAPPQVLALPAMARTDSGRIVRLDRVRMVALLGLAPQSALGVPIANSPIIIELPTPDGGFEKFAFAESSVMHPLLQAKFPQIRTYIGQGVDRPAATVHFDLTPLGFHASVMGPASAGVDGAKADAMSAWYIDPISRGDADHHVVYWRGGLHTTAPWTCDTPPDAAPVANLGLRGPGEVDLRTLDVAIAATGEYTTYHSQPNPSNLAAGMAALATTVNRVNQLYIRDLALNIRLPINNDQIVFVDPANDPYVPSNPMAGLTGGDLQAQNSAIIAARIADSDYQLGHVVHAGDGGGNAGGIGTVCTANKATGYTMNARPDGTLFWVDYVAHEIGHQCGANHTFNGLRGSCGDQWFANAAYEPGSGISIMGYAGICNDMAGSDDLATPVNNPPGMPPPPPIGASIPMFSWISIQEILVRLSAGPTCGFAASTGNHHPSPAIVGSGLWTIPANTPFRLVAGVSDQDFGQTLTLSWEEADRGAQRTLGPDSGANEPLFRPFMPGDGERSFPAISTVLGGPAILGENLPRFDRTMSFRCVARDNFAQGGGVSFASATVVVARTPGDVPFRVTAPAAGAQFCGGQVMSVTWDVAASNGPPVSCEFVDIALSLDGGQTYPIGLASGTPNSGVALVVVPAISTPRARVRVEAVDNIFYNVNPGNFSIAAEPPFIEQQPQDVAVCPGQPATLTVTPGILQPAAIQWYKDNAPIPGATDGSLVFVTTSNSDSGDYKATLTNGCGQVTTRTARLQVGVSLDGLTPLPSMPQPCQQMVASVQARGVGPLTYRWFRNGSALNDGGGIAGASGPSLTFTGVRYEQEGVYEVEVTDSCGPRRFSTGELILAGPVWTRVGVTPAPGGFGQASDGWVLAHDEGRGVSVMYGGYTNTGQRTNSLWEFDGVSWTPRLDASAGVIPQPGQELFGGPFAPRAFPAAYSPDHHAVYFAASGGFSQPLRMWRWDGVAWSTVAERAGSGDGDTLLAMAYDRARHRMVIVRVGGSGGPSEVLEFDPTTNQFTVGPSVPLATTTLLAQAKFVYDQKRSVALLYQRPGNFTPPVLYTYNGAWSTLSGTPADIAPTTPMTYDPVRLQAVGLGGYEDFTTCGTWQTQTTVFPDGPPRYSTAMPPATAWGTALPDGPPRNPGGAGLSPDNPFSARMIAFDTRRRAALSVGGDGMSSFTCGTPTWEAWERRYFDVPMFDRQPPATLDSLATVVITARPAGQPTLSLRWRRNGQPISDGPGPGGSTLSGATTATLTIANSSSADNGTYTLAVTNGCGTVISSPAVLGPPRPRADVSGDGVLSVQDIFDFLALYFSNDPRADFNGSGGISVQDIFDFLAAYFAGD